jgi:stringent starvation protein B
MSNTFTPMGHHLLNAYRAWFMENNTRVMNVVLIAANNTSPFVRGLANSAGLALLNIHPAAVRDFLCDASGLSFKARFNGTEQHLFFHLDCIVEVQIPMGSGVVTAPVFSYSNIAKLYGLIPRDEPSPNTPAPAVSKLRVIK